MRVNNKNLILNYCIFVETLPGNHDELNITNDNRSTLRRYGDDVDGHLMVDNKLSQSKKSPSAPTSIEDFPT